MSASFAPDARRALGTGAPRRRPRPADALARRLVLRMLEGISGGRLLLREGERELSFGSQAPDRGLAAVVEVRSPRLYRELLRGSIGLCDSYLDGLWECEDLVSLARLAALNVERLDRLRRALRPLLAPGQRLAGALARNTPRRARRRIAAHYDLGNDLFAELLDPSMSYSCALFERPGASLHEAALAKLDLVCEKLDLGAGDRVLEIGGGWGGFAVHAARRRGCRVTTVTLSREQCEFARAWVAREGLQDRVEVLLCDYRDAALVAGAPHGGYDKLVSIEMIEAVGWQYLPAFFARCSELLAVDGAMLLQAIVIDDGAYEVEKAGRSFINTYIFPGGCLPSMESLARALARADLRQVHLQDITPHYARTLACWRERLLAAAPRLQRLGYDERFVRLWELYLSYCEGGFRERRIRDVQLLLAKPGYRGEAAAR